MELLRLFFVVLLSSPGYLLDCPGTGEFLDANSLMHFENCTHVTGNVIIKLSTFQNTQGVLPIAIEQLSFLRSIQEIDGYLLIENVAHVNFTNLRFLRNLQIIHGTQTLQLLNRRYSLVVTQNDFLRTLNLASLRSIKNGGVQIANNPELCLVDTITIEDYLTDGNIRRIGGLSQDCTDVMCHEQCLMNRGCWGVLADECIECRHYNYLGICVESCNMSVSYVDENLQQCIPHLVTTYQPRTESVTTDDIDASTAHENGITTTVHSNSEGNPTHYSSTTENHTATIATNATTPPVTSEDGQSFLVITVSPGVGLLLLCIAILSIVFLLYCYCSKKSRKSKSLKCNQLVTQTEKNQLDEKGTRKDCESQVRQSHVSIGSLARAPTFSTSPTLSSDQQSSHDYHMTLTNETSFHAPLEGPPTNNTTLNPNPPMHQDLLISAHINAYTSSTTPTNKTPSPNLIHQRTRHVQPAPTMGAGGVYSTHHSHRGGTLTASRGTTSSRMSHSRSSSQHHSRASSSGVSSVRVTASTRTSVNSLNGLHILE